MPGSVAVGPADCWDPHAATVTRRTAIAAKRDPIFGIEAPPLFMKMYLNSLCEGAPIALTVWRSGGGCPVCRSAAPANSRDDLGWLPLGRRLTLRQPGRSAQGEVPTPRA